MSTTTPVFTTSQRLTAEALGTFWLVLGGCGTAVLAGPWKDVPAYAAAQVVGATVAGALLLAIASGKPGFDAVASGFATNGYGDRSPGGYGFWAVVVTEVVLTAFFLFVILGASSKRAAVGFSGLAIGLALTLIHLVSIPVSNTSVNPARSLGVAWFAGGEALSQVWVFILAPVVGAAIAGLAHAALLGDDEEDAADAQ